MGRIRRDSSHPPGMNDPRMEAGESLA